MSNWNQSAAHHHSFRVVKIEVLAEHTRRCLADATGFFCEYRRRTFLVTNWHVVSGRHYQTNKPLHRSQALPGKLAVHSHISKTVVPISAPESSTSFYLELYAENDRPAWFEHPLFGRNVDVVAIDVSTRLPECDRLYRINIEEELDRKLKLAVMDQAFVTGYPLQASTTPNSLPIYKSGTIASEPRVFDSEPRIYIDGKTKTGMSGSPVMVKVADQPNGALALVGIYSGRDRQERSEFEAELGIVWPYRECLVPILEACIDETASNQDGAPTFAKANQQLQRR